MPDGWVLIDTSAWIHALRPDGIRDIRQQVAQLLSAGRAATCPMVVLELLGGTRTDSEFRVLREDLEALRNLSISDEVWRVSCHLNYTLRRKGFSIPATDHLIAAAAIVNDCWVLHHDRHFDVLAAHSGLRVLRA